ncbi:MlaD family protein [Phyllobacterium leguminum]|uniref:Phospholipid/cholesterol/gamma-HCH transport system substrate-binding protein n=1 Tax=Phyllobacterium leguminum TaxID=314237 RepID=A0A318TAB6_9HYPH|nr:MlaD family protein [Phyllobacterium leguminum]PYE89966.1 phospholipid/cholesterol/gamma-HCH transport system substrate-binding protein [Phyllobacterium leguminum]
METKANYVLVGIFTLLVCLAAFAFVYWVARYGENRDTAPLEIRIPGSVTGLSVGSQVLFNGIKVGDVRRLQLDPTNPNMVIAQTEVNRTTPITRSTKAQLAMLTLTGQAYLELNGGSLNEPNLLEEAAKTDTVARINADPSAYTNLLSTAQDVAAKANNVLDGLQGFVKDVRGPLTETVKNTEIFTDALAKNSKMLDELAGNAGDVQQIVKEAREMMGRLNAASARADSVMQKVDGLLSENNKDSVVSQTKATLQSIQQTSNTLNSRIGPIADNLQRFSGQGLRDVQALVTDSRRSIQRIEQAITDLERDPQRLIFGGQGNVPQYDGRTRH